MERKIAPRVLIDVQQHHLSVVGRARGPTFVVEAVDAIDGSTLVVAPQNEEILRVLDLESKLPARPKMQ
jgi:hypothetical protein